MINTNSLEIYAVITFIITTIIYVYVKIKHSDKIKESMMLGIYFAVTIIIQFIFNYAAIESHCGSKNASGVISYLLTVTPWLFIFGIVLVIIYFIPMWKEPFANTFGYFFIEYINKDNSLTKKNIISEGIWYMLSGVLSLVVSFSSINNIKCNLPMQEMMNRDKEYETIIKENKNIEDKFKEKLY